MSNSLAIAAVTATLQRLIGDGLKKDVPDGLPSDLGLSGVAVTSQQPENPSGEEPKQINLFLYLTEVNAAFRNMDLPNRVKPGETGQPPLALTLYYLLTAYGRDQNNDDLLAHFILGHAMRTLHDHPILTSAEIKIALAGNDLYEQIESVRITPQPMSLDEMYKLWSSFQARYRVSAAYRVSVALIDSARPVKAPLPVLRRAADDSGVASQPDVIQPTPPFPMLETVSPSNVHLNQQLTVTGFHLDATGDSVVVRLKNPRLAKDRELAPEAGRTATQLKVLLPDEANKLPAGVYTLSLVVKKAGKPDQISNELPFAIAPQITNARPITAARDVNGNVKLTLTCKPETLPEQSVSLLLGDREIRAEAHTAQTASLQFVIIAAPAGDSFLRLRIDGVDSLLVDRSVTPPIFFDTEKVTIT
jgi:uncharacterized protein DUF4255